MTAVHKVVQAAFSICIVSVGVCIGWPRPARLAPLHCPIGHAVTADVILIVGLWREVRGWRRMWRFRGHRKWIFIGSSQFLHLVSMRVVLDCGVVRSSGGYRMSGLRREGPVFF